MVLRYHAVPIRVQQEAQIVDPGLQVASDVRVADFLAIFGEATTRKPLPTENAYSTDDSLNKLGSIGIFRAAVKLVKSAADRRIKATDRMEPEYAERIDIALNTPVIRLSGLCGGFYPMKLTRLIIAIANRRGRKIR